MTETTFLLKKNNEVLKTLVAMDVALLEGMDGLLQAVAATLGTPIKPPPGSASLRVAMERIVDILAHAACGIDPGVSIALRIAREALEADERRRESCQTIPSTLGSCEESPGRAS